ncbi:CLUMA_CG015324, isoform A [Clunio marinus]|uniref:Protein cueball n=1 Tax=Clunio marinus TaxID=568069 RepID=A0A1J1IS85_9DIPT|nr:CLUMA_CG015324, isoform A [Clunio marinus]
MTNNLVFNKKILVLLVLLCIQKVTSFWEFAVCTKEKIIFYDDKWSLLETSVRKDGLEHLKSISYDAVNDVFYFTDRKHPQTSIFSLKVKNDTTFLTTPLVARSENEVIQDLVYDFHDDALYWSDSGNKKIVKLIFDRSKNLKFHQETFLNVDGDLAGLELDSCQRNLYYTIVTENNPSINVVSLDTTKVAKPISFGNKDHYKPTAIAMDHQKRRLYVADVRNYNSYSIDSMAADGSDFRTEISKEFKMPRSVAVDSEYVYYVEGNDHELRRFVKDSNKKASEKLKELPFDPSDIIIRSNFFTDLDPQLCKVSQKKIEQVKKEIENQAQKENLNKMCLHGGTLDMTTSNCMCMENFDGDYCEINLCYNFCLNGGECSMNRNEISQRFEAKCSCKKGYTGEHCEVDVCSNYCLNDGKCSIDLNKKPKCSCGAKSSGSRCENLQDDSSSVLIKSPTTTTTKVPESLSIHEGVPEILSLEAEEHPEILSCTPNSINITYVILGVCLTISLLLFLIILVVIKKVNGPTRPKIRKKYVVHKNIEPLTYRPTTEQCEVIIEDCCNMNICETPCFDPKVLQQEINEGNISVKLTSSKKCSSKEDKQDLLKNMEYNQ